MSTGSLFAAARARVPDLRYGFLFLPGAVALVAAALAPLLLAVDRARGPGGAGIGFDAQTDAARALLVTIAGSLITVAGLTFSITIVSLQLVSQQFSPRALRGFLGDRLNQVVAGTFIGTFLYCLLVLRTVSGETESEKAFVPAVAVTAAVVLAVGSIALLLVFIHHMAQTIQVSSIAAGIARQALETLEPLYAETFGEPSDEDPVELVRRWDDAGPPRRVYPERAGYLRAVAFENLADLVSTRGLRARVVHAPGDFVTEETPLVEYWRRERDERFEETVRRATSVASERELRQDTEFGLRQLADIALKAISPGVNDPTTAVTCIGYIRAVLERLAARPTPCAVRRYAAIDATLVARARSFAEYVDTGFVELGRYGARDARVAIALLHAIAAVTRSAQVAQVDAPDRIATLRRAAADIAARARAEAGTSRDALDLEAALAAVEAAGST